MPFHVHELTKADKPGRHVAEGRTLADAWGLAKDFTAATGTATAVLQECHHGQPRRVATIPAGAK